MQNLDKYTSQRVNIKLYFDLGTINPDAPIAKHIDTTRISEVITGTYSSDFNIELRCTGNRNYTYAQAKAMSDFPWSSVNQIHFTGALNPNDTINVNILSTLTLRLLTFLYNYLGSSSGYIVCGRFLPKNSQLDVGNQPDYAIINYSYG